MKIARSLSTLLAAVALGAGAAHLAAPLFHEHEDPRASIQPMWAHEYPTLEDMARDADAVVLATVAATSPGRMELTSNGRNVLPFTLVELHVEAAIRGPVAPIVVLEQTGGSINDLTIYMEDDGGPFSAGTREVLFLKEQPGTGFHYLAHPKGRFHVEGDFLRAATPGDPVSRELHGRTVLEAARIVADVR